MHEKCALWSAGVAKRKRERPEVKVPEAERFIGLDVCVAHSIGRKCVLCSKTGASVKCAAESGHYHWPCATASGSFMHKASQTLVGHKVLDQVPKHGEQSTFAWLFAWMKLDFLGELKAVIITGECYFWFRLLFSSSFS